MTDSFEIDLDTLCRICLKNEGTLSIFSESESENEYTLQERIMSFAYVEIYEGDGLPSHICGKCHVQINQAFKLKAQCEYADAWLRQCVSAVVEDGEEIEDIKPSPEELAMGELRDTNCVTENLKPSPDELASRELSEAECLTEFLKPSSDELASRELSDTECFTEDLQQGPDEFSTRVLSEAECFSEDISRHSEDEIADIKVLVPTVEEPGKSFKEVDSNHFEMTKRQPSSNVLVNQNIPLVILSTGTSEILNNTDGERRIHIILGNEKGTNNVSVKRRITLKKQTEPHKCIYCDKQFALQGSLINHLREHEPTGDFPCIECGRSFPHEILLDFHVKTHTAERPYCCSQCGKCFMQLSTCISHERNHARKKPYLCNHCGKVLASRKGHFCPSQEKREKIHQCNVCGKKFMRSTTLATHKKRHLLVERYRCKTCYKPFYTSQELRRHTYLHLGVRPFACSVEGCDRTFLTQGEINRHMRYHKGEKKFKCDLCPKLFFESGHLVNHRRKHTGERPFICRICDKSFTDASKLKRHEAIHSNSSSRRTSKNNRQKSTFAKQLTSDDKYDESLETTWAMLNDGTIEEEIEEALESEETS